jgi:hypothetical protein
MGCPWISRNCSHDKNIEALRTCQAIFKRKLTSRKLEQVIPEITAIYYSPGCKGEHIASRAFSATLSGNARNTKKFLNE